MITRINNHEALRATLIQAAVSATPNAGLDKQGMTKMIGAFNKLLAALRGDSRGG